MRGLNGLVALLCTGVLAAVGGCQTVGPEAIDLGRDRYNGVLHSTSMQQTMSNIVRAYYYEPPMFMDVTEVDATQTFTGGVSGGGTNIGARAGKSGGTLSGVVGNASGTISYNENPTIRYQPLLGQALVAQLVTPVSVDALGQLYDSYWDIGALLDLSAAYLTLDYKEFYPALNTIIELNHRGGLELAAGSSSIAAPPANAGAAPGSSADLAPTPPSKPAADDAVIIYLRPFHPGAAAADLENRRRVLQLWIRLLRIYADTQPPFASPPQCRSLGLTLDKGALRDWDVNIATHVAGSPDQRADVLATARDCLPGSIELRVAPLRRQSGAAPAPRVSSDAPVMRTYSALGILKNATERPGPRIEFVTPEQYRHIRADPWNTDVESMSYYTLTPDELDSFNCAPSQIARGGCDTPLPAAQQAVNTEVDRWIRNSSGQDTAAYPSGLDVYEQPGTDVLDPRSIDMNGRLGTLRRYILIVVDSHAPGGAAYASCLDDGRWYYIEKGDTVSEKNFQLLALFMTMMAVPPTSAPLTPTINVGG